MHTQTEIDMEQLVVESRVYLLLKENYRACKFSSNIIENLPVSLIIIRFFSYLNLLKIFI